MQQSSYRKPARKRLADMTPAEQLAYQVARVQQLGLRVVGEGHFKADGSPFWIVPSTSEKLKNMHHIVRKTAKGLTCDCYACSESGLICPHRATVYLHLQAQAKQEATPAPAKPPAVQVSSPVVKQPQPAVPARASSSSEQWDRYQDARMDEAIYVPADYKFAEYR